MSGQKGKETKENQKKLPAMWLAAGCPGVTYDRAAMVARTKENPWWVHFGAGNIFRAFPARVADELLEKGILDRGIIVVEGFDEELLQRAYVPYDNSSIVVTLKADGTMEKRVIGSVAEAIPMTNAGTVIQPKQPGQPWLRLCEIMKKASVQMLSFTITEKGYAYLAGDGTVLPEVETDCLRGPEAGETLSSYMGRVAALLYVRFQAGRLPLALVSMDNCSENGRKLSEVLCFYARSWEEKGLAEPGFLSWLQEEQSVSFPWTMIDKITPRPDEQVRAQLAAEGLVSMELIVTEKQSYTAPFVNAEECEYLVIEDVFPAGRPELEKGGILFADRETVKKTERMKVSTCLNPLHTALAVFGCLLGIPTIHAAMQDKCFRTLAERLGWQEGMAVVTNPGILKPEEFLSEVLEKRLPNPFLPDTPARIATDTSQKLAVRFGETVKAYEEKGLPLTRLSAIPFVYAGWLRYLCGIDDEGKAFRRSPDPKLAELESVAEGLRGLFGGNEPKNLTRSEMLRGLACEVLCRTDIFGLDITQTELLEPVLAELTAMLEVGAVRRRLQEHTELWEKN